MAIKASTTITISKYRDTDSVTRYYKLQASTAAAPAKPTTLEPSGWATSEPSYTSGSTNTLYFCDRSKFSDGTFSYSDVSKSSSYEAAKAAYNKAQNAQNSVDNMEIGGRNLALGSQTVDTSKDFINGSQFEVTEDTYKNCTVVKSQKAWTDGCTINLTNIIKRNNLKAGDILTFSTWFKTDDPSAHNYVGYYSPTSTSVSSATAWKSFGSNVIFNDWTRFIGSLTINSNMIALVEANTNITLRIEPTSNVSDTEKYYYYWAATKLEIGNKATDWTPAPEDVDEDVQKAQDTASDAYNKANEAANNANVAKTEVNSLKATITNFVKDDKGYVKVVTTSDGLQIDMSTVTEKIDEAINGLADKVASETYAEAIKKLNDELTKTTARTAYINATTENGKPVITLGADTSPFKLKITNTAIEFIQNNQVIATANGDAFFSNRSIAATEVQMGPMNSSSHDAFAWQMRASGNLGLVYKQV